MMQLIFKIGITSAFIFCSLFSTSSFAQITDKNATFWLSVVPTLKISDQVKITSEFHWRRGEFVNIPMQNLVRPSITYTPIKGLSLTLGYTYLDNHPIGEFGGAIAFPENNLWEQVALTNTYGKVKVTHRFRLEHRWIGLINLTGVEPYIEDTNFVNRFRYRLIGNVPVFKIKEVPVSLTVFNELMVILDKLRPSSVNQNWMVGLLNFHLPHKSKISVGIQNQYIVRGDGNRISNTAMWLSYGKEFKFKGKTKKVN